MTSNIEERSGKTCEQCFLSTQKSLAELGSSWHNLKQPSNSCNLWLWLIYSQPRNGVESCCYICVVNVLAFPITGLCHRSPGMFLFPDRVSISLKLYSPVQLLGFMSPNFAFNLYSSIFFPNISVSHLGIVPEKNTWSSSIPHCGICLPVYWVKWNSCLWAAPYFGSKYLWPLPFQPQAYRHWLYYVCVE